MPTTVASPNEQPLAVRFLPSTPRGTGLTGDRDLREIRGLGGRIAVCYLGAWFLEVGTNVSWGRMVDSASCSRCSAAVQPGARFCAACGRELKTPSLRSERRSLTFLFCDLVDSIALSRKLDAEDLADLLESYQSVCREAVASFDGRVTQFLGDGVVAFFGYPSALEEGEVHAIHAALRVIDEIKIVNRGIAKSLGVELHVRAGIHTGEAVVGELGPIGSHQVLAVGENVNLAARIQAVAAPDTVVVSLETAKRIKGHFQIEALDPQSLKGFDEMIELYRIVGATGARTKLEAAARGQLTPRVGRQWEMDVIASSWTEVQNGASRVLLLRGEAGIGKSRLVHDFRESALASGAEVFECFCSRLADRTALAPIVELLNAQVAKRAGGETSADTRLSVLDGMLREHGCLGEEDVLPLVSSLLSIPGADERPIQDLSPGRRRTRTLEVVRDWLSCVGRRAPLAFLVEDIHWADPSTLDLLDLIVGDGSVGRTLVCLTARPEFRDQWSGPHVRTLDLPRLSGGDAEAIVNHVAGSHALSVRDVRQIVERSEGVPLFVEEVTKAVIEAGHLPDTDRSELENSPDGEFVPAPVQSSIEARFDRLGQSRVVARYGAIIGREFAYPLVKAVTGMSDAELRGHLDRLCQSEIVFADGEPPNAVYTFKHALIQVAIRNTVLRKERAVLHERVFAKLREELPELVAARPEVAAYHAEKAGMTGVAVPLLKAAGMRAFGRTAMAEAAKHLGHAIEIVGALAEPARTAMEMDLQAIVGPAYMATLGWAVSQVETSSERLRDLAMATGDIPKLYQATWSLWTVHFLRGQLDLALELAQQVFDMAVKSGDPLLRITGHHAMGFTHERRGEYAEAIRHADEGLALFDLEREKSIVAQFVFSSTCAILWFRGQSQLATGQIKSGIESLHRAAKLVDELQHSPSRCFLLSQQCWSLAVGDIVEVETLAQTMRSLAIDEGFALWVHYADIFLAWAAARQGGNAAAAVDKIKAAMAHMHKDRSHIQDNELATLLAETLLLAGRPEEVFGALEETLVAAKRGQQRHLEAEVLRFQGEAAKAMGDVNRAMGFYRQAIESANSVGARLLELRASLSLARVGGPRERAQLKSIFDEFTDGFDHVDLKQASAFLATHGPAAGGGFDGLRA
jgi:class 3 adenylate cyclase/tetratricopeptide (TPR) repeat protein